MTDETIRVQPDDEATDATRTRRADEFASYTLRVADEGSVRQPGMPMGAAPAGTVLCGDCVVERALHPHETGRPGLFLCRAPEGRVVVKVAPTQHPPRPELWQRLPYLHHPHVLRTHRILEHDGFFFEVQEYCDGGSLETRVPKPGLGVAPVSAEWLMTVFLPQMHAALGYLHAQDIIHRDIKPANIYMKTVDGRETLVLGDFDISAVLENTRTSRDTQRIAGTWVYTAPEAFPRFVDDRAGGRKGRVTRSSDFYSLAITLIELLLGTTSLHLCQLADLFDFYLQGGRVEIPQGIPGRLMLLLRGLLIRNRHIRWTGDEVGRWLAGANTDEDLQRIHEDEAYEFARAGRPYRLNDRFAVDLPSLADAMFHEPEVATEDIITGDVLLNWIGALDPTVAREIKRDRDRLYMHPDLVLHAAVQRCDPSWPFIFADGTSVDTPDAWIDAAMRVARMAKADAEAFCTTALLHQLESWLRLHADARPELADGVGRLHDTPPATRLEELAYLLRPEMPFQVMRGVAVHTPKELARLAYDKPEEWASGRRPVAYDACCRRWRDGGLAAWLRQRGLAELSAQCDVVREELADDSEAAWETVLRLLDPELPPVTVRVDTADIGSLRSIPYGKSRSFTLRYTTVGPGLPFGAWQLKTRTPGVTLSAPVLRGREGELRLTVDAAMDIPAGTVHQGALTLKSGFTRLEKEPLRFGYRVVYETAAALRRMAIGAGIGALALGVPRLFFSVVGWPGAQHPQGGDTRWVWDGTVAGELPLLPAIGAFLVLGICIFIALRLWFRAFRESET